MKPADAFRKAALLVETDECYGCCTALVMATGSLTRGLDLARARMAELLGYVAEDPVRCSYWWPVCRTEHECVTPRLIALELCALLSEEDALSKSPKR